MSIYINSGSGTYTPHIVHPANGRPNTEESWIEFTGSGYGTITMWKDTPLESTFDFSVPAEGTVPITLKIGVHVQKNQTILELKSSAPVSLSFTFWSNVYTYEFTNAQIRLLPVDPYFEIIHVK
jgi:hypothetical protein